MQYRVIFALACSCLLHVAVLFAVSTTPKGLGSLKALDTRPPSILVNVTSPNVNPHTFNKLAIQPAIPQNNKSPPATIAEAASPSSAERAITPGALARLENLPTTQGGIDQPQSLYGLEGKSKITYWPSDEVDQAALMLAEWPEGVSPSAWPSGQFVSLELWINPNGALAQIAFSQKDLPDSLRIMLVEVISGAGFKPAIKNGEPVGNHRILEVLLSQISVPPLVKY
jgi:hypothetical protein